MTIQGAIAELQSLLDADDVPFCYKGGIEKVIETIRMDLKQDCDECPHARCLYEADRKTGNSSEKPNSCEDEPQTDCAWKKPLPEFNCKECKWWSPITKTCHYDGFPCKYEPIPII